MARRADDPVHSGAEIKEGIFRITARILDRQAERRA